ncbi:hypothetical protein FALBO_854 [Fusarium albosuccineum]|uniref:Uncharacterized protein n=1 Tax=Fusarium albosuccineum TaxID=1237068 RepID=A0A8H4PM79_9HYPO|nr:hypothetical protein FALBO_854 [Fusarium albosuccineum]
MLYPNPLCTWTGFQYSTSETLDESTFEPLVTRRTNYQELFYGRITEFPDHCVLMIIWHSPKAYWAFQNSVQNDELLNNLNRSQDTAPATQIINFRGQMVWRHMKGPRNDVRIAHFPDPISKETKQDISSVKG